MKKLRKLQEDAIFYGLGSPLKLSEASLLELREISEMPGTSHLFEEDTLISESELDVPDTLEMMKVKSLRLLAQDLEISLKGISKKQEIIKVIRDNFEY